MMTEKVKVMIEDRQTEIKLPRGIRMLVRRTCSAVLKMENFPNAAEVSVSFVSMEEIQDLNKHFRGKDAVTDVLSFPLGEDGEYDINPDTGASLLGDVVICAKRADDQARIYDHRLQREIGFLTAHSVLHLLGYDHVDDPMGEEQMREKEEEVMQMLGLSRFEGYEEYN